MEITVRYGYPASIGSLVWALTKKASDLEGRLIGAGDGQGTLDLPLAWRNGRASDYSDRAALLLNTDVSLNCC